MLMLRRFFLGLMILHPSLVQAADRLATWNVVPEKSSIHFTGSQNGVPIEGKFSDFQAQIFFTPEHLESSSLKVFIKTDSISADYEDVATHLKKPEWFDTGAYPMAMFESRIFTHLGGNQYEARGALTLKGIKKNVVLPFTLDIIHEGNVERAVVKGETEIKRTEFGIGQGEWASTGVVADNVKVAVEVTATQEN